MSKPRKEYFAIRKLPQEQDNQAMELQRPSSSQEFQGERRDPKSIPFSIDRTFSASSEMFDNEEENDDGNEGGYVHDFAPIELGSFGVDIEGNIIGNVNLPFGEEDEDYFCENDEHEQASRAINMNMAMATIDDYPNDQIQESNSPTNRESHSLPEDLFDDHDATHSNSNVAGNINNEVVEDDPNNPSGHGNGVHRKKSILRHTHDKVFGGSISVNSFNGSAGGSSIISDGKMVSSSGSFNSQFYNNFYSRAARRNDFQRYTRGPYAPLDRCNSTSASSANSSTIAQHYYPEGGWGHVILATAMFSHALLSGFLLSGGTFATKVLERFGHELRNETVWLMSLALGGSLLLSPLWVAICQRRSTRLSAVFGGLVASLGCLFTSFASQFHQLFFSYVIFQGVGVGLVRDASMLMVGQYFKRKRDFVEIFLVSASGLGILAMSTFMEYALSAIGWRLGLQAITGTLVLTFFLGSCYRSASLYHPQRRAIIHLKNQKRKEKEKKNDSPPFLDVTFLRDRKHQIFLLACAIQAWGLYSPLFHLALECQDADVDETERLLVSAVYIGGGWTIGCLVFGFLSMGNEQCRISKFYLCEVAALVAGISIIALTTVKEVGGLATFAWAYGLGLGGYHYMLKIWTYEKTRARVFPTAWSFVQSVQGASLLFGIPVTGYINTSAGWRKGYFLSGGTILFGIFVMFISTVGARRLTRHKSSRSSMKTCETTDSMQSPGMRRISFNFPDDGQISPPRVSKEERSSYSGSERSRMSRNLNNSIGLGDQQMPKELTRISEEGILDTNH